MMSRPDTEKIIQMAVAPWETLHCNWSRGEWGRPTGLNEEDKRKTFRSLGEEHRLERDVDPALVFGGACRTCRCVFVFSGVT